MFTRLREEKISILLSSGGRKKDVLKTLFDEIAMVSKNRRLDVIFVLWLHDYR